MSTSRIVDSLVAQSVALNVLVGLRQQLRPWHSLDEVRSMLDSEIRARGVACGLAPDALDDLQEAADDAFAGKAIAEQLNAECA